MRSSGASPPPDFTIGIDTGGTFTDFSVRSAGASWVLKVPSTPRDPAGAVLSGLATIVARLRLPRRAIALVHGTTVGTNALLTRSLAKTAFVTTAGFEDLIEIGRQNRERLYDLDAGRPAPIVPRALRLGVEERVAPAAAVWSGAGSGRRGATVADADAPGAGVGGGRDVQDVPGEGGRAAAPRDRVDRRAPGARELARLVRRVRALAPESVAVGFLHAYLDPANERLAGRALRRLGLPITLSHEISGEFREYERFATTLANAALRPLAERYFLNLERGASPSRLAILLSDGTTAVPAAAAREPVRTVLSGPAGGVLAAEALGRRLGDRAIVTLDMGGTSTDVAFIAGALPRVSHGSIGGTPIRSPMIEVMTVGAGGGSIARRDAGGALRVGPESAGADPGPACYGRGDRPTVTDANLLLGRIPARGLLGGASRLDRERSRAALARLGRSLGLGATRAAEGTIEVVEATMENALRAISLERGRDPRGAALYAFGGAGPLHACRLAERLGIAKVVVPNDPGAFSAGGLATASPGAEAARTILAAPREAGRLRAALAGIERELGRRLAVQGVPPERIRFARFADLRYRGQSHEITVPFGGAMERAFTRAHEALYRHARPGAPIEVVAVRVRARAPAPSPRGRLLAPASAPRGAPAGGAGAAAAAPARGPLPGGMRARLVVGGRGRACPLHERESLRPGRIVRGPAIVAEYSATTFVPPGWRLLKRASGELVLTPARGGGERPR